MEYKKNNDTFFHYGKYNGPDEEKIAIIPDGITIIDKGAFEDCRNLETIIIPNSVKLIRNGAFAGCSNLKNITIPNGVKYIWPKTFYGCSKLENIVIPNGVKIIDDRAFAGCSNLKNIIIPDSVKIIDDRAFEGCSKLNSVPSGTLQKRNDYLEENVYKKERSIYDDDKNNSVDEDYSDDESNEEVYSDDELNDEDNSDNENNSDVSKHILNKYNQSDENNIDDEKEDIRNPLEEEIGNLRNNVNSLENEKDSISLPYVIESYESGMHYEESLDRQYRIMRNQESKNEIYNINKYLNCNSLYIGHLSCNGYEYYFNDKYLPSKKLTNGNVLISVDDSSYGEIFKKWKYPKKNEGIRFSRNIDIKFKEIKNVTEIYYEKDSVSQNVSDLFLQHVLIKNKTSKNIQSIIETIQEEQNEIRTYDGNSSIVVQGCAGSGKTMILLHRFRYLKYNGIIDSDNYALLVPSVNFKKFISSTAHEFKLYENNIYTYVEYYRQLLNYRDKNFKEENELNFTKRFLSTVYSEDFISKCYVELINFIKTLIDKTIDMSDEKLTKMYELTKKLNEKITSVLSKSTRFANFKISDYSGFDEVMNALKTKRDAETIKIDHQITELKNIPKSEIEQVVKSNEDLVSIQNEIDIETQKSDKSSTFTKTAHLHKLAILKTKYEEKKKTIVDHLKLECSEKISEKIKSLNKEKELLKDIVNTIEREIKLVKNNYDAIIFESEEKFKKKYESGINSLEKLINISTNMEMVYKNSLKNLTYCKELCEYTKLTINTARTFINYEPKLKIEMKIPEIVEDALNQEKEKSISKVLFNKIFEIATNELKNQFNITLDKKYKHYWFIHLYFAYLVGWPISEPKKYLFIDEAQDLSPSEIKLLQKVTSVHTQPVYNLFGDINQTISCFGVKQWEQIDNIDMQFRLNQNFRNTNEIINYCIQKLNLRMQPVGVSMGPVKEFDFIDDMIDMLMNAKFDKVFVVKDERNLRYLRQFLMRKHIFDYKSYTVKEIKGLEFEQVIVLDEDMIRNEKYISYTRALIQLYVVKHSPWNLKCYEIGNEFDFGIYNNQPILWCVLDKIDNKLLVISKCILDSKRFDEKTSDYNKSEIKIWLENDFKNAAFSEAEVKIIDKIYLLSKDEVEKYFETDDIRKTMSINNTHDLSWWISSEFEEGAAYTVDSNGCFDCNYVYEKNIGVRVACLIKIDD